MPLSIHPGISPSVVAPAASPVRHSAARSVEVESVVVEERSTKRSAEYVAALRELREEQLHPRHNHATRTYLQIAHYEGDFQLVDVYT